MKLGYETQLTLSRIFEQIQLDDWTQAERDSFKKEMDQHFPELFRLLLDLYGHHYDLIDYLKVLTQNLAKAYKQNQQKNTITDPSWYLSEKTVGIALYVDLFAGNLSKLRQKIPYLKSLGINYVHLMPLYKAPEGNSDGGYAVSDYRQVDKKLGSAKQLRNLADAFHDQGIKLVLDFVFNHTSDEHEWAQKALEGETRYEEFYYFFDDENEVKEYNQTVREIFPQVRRGSFSYLETQQKWVWTTFNSFQWDLNYANPDVFVSIVDEMLFLAELGCDVLRLDALAFVWKEKGTLCENLPKAHTLIRAFNKCLRIATPQVLFKSEAIVHPDEVIKYISLDECEISYNPLNMALMWESLATRDTRLLTKSLQKSFQLDPGCTWVNYIRCHDDIGWTWDDALSDQQGINGSDHRRFLNQFYTGRQPGSFAKGVAFQENPVNGDCRVCGTLASLCGVEQALALEDDLLLAHALKRVKMLNALLMSLGGIPLIYQGDDLGVLNDYDYVNDPQKAEDGRWVNRKQLTSHDFKLARNSKSYQGNIQSDLKHLINLRQNHKVFGDAQTIILDNANSHLFCFYRKHQEHGTLLVIANFSEHEMFFNASHLPGIRQSSAHELISNQLLDLDNLSISAWGINWLLIEE